MRSELLLTEKIEQYLEGTLNPAEHSAFELQIANDIDLQNEVSLQKEIIAGFQRTALKKEVAVAFLKYKKIALLFKLGMIGASAIVGTAVTVAVIHYTNKDNQNLSDNNLPTNLITINDSTKIMDSAFVETNAYNYSQDSLNNQSSETALLSNTNNASDNTNNPSSATPNNPPSKTFPADLPNKTGSGLPESGKTLEDTTGSKAQSPPPANKIPKPNKNKKDTRLPDLFWTQGTSITWLGIDFANARLLGKFSEITNTIEKDSAKSANKYFKEWNDVIVIEKRKNNFKAAFNNKFVQYYVDYIGKKNDTIKAQRLFVTNAAKLNHLNINSIQKIVNGYKLDGKEGLGLVFIVESLDKTKQKGAVYATIIDMKTNEVLLTEKIITNPHGNGLRNYWANSFSNTIAEIEKKYPEWRKKYKL